jgi:DNA-binding GntR family transcriptional regulator
MTAVLTKLGPLTRGGTLADQVEVHIRNLLIGGQLAPDDKLSLRSTAEAMGVSMMPVREAMSRLVAEQALEVLPNRAVRVPLMTLSTFRELTSIRVVVEGHAAAVAAQQATADEIGEAARYEADFLRESGKTHPDLAKAVAANRDLHFSVYRAAHMPVLMQMIERLWLQIGPVLNLDLRASPHRLKEGVAKDFHAALIAALWKRDPDAAQAAISGDIRSAAAVIEARKVLLDT